MNAPDTPETIAVAVMETFREALHLEPPEPGVDLFDESGLDSLMFITFLDALERKFAIRIELESIALEEIQSLDAIAGFIGRARSQALEKKGIDCSSNVSPQSTTLCSSAIGNNRQITVPVPLRRED